jgi:hypothetical protein
MKGTVAVAAAALMRALFFRRDCEIARVAPKDRGRSSASFVGAA